MLATVFETKVWASTVEQEKVRALDGASAGEETAVDCIDNGSCCNHPAAKVSAVETQDGILASLNLVELQVDITLGVGVERDVDDVSILLFSFLTDVIFQFFSPVLAFFPVTVLAGERRPRQWGNVLIRIEHVLENNAATGSVHVDRQRLGLSLGFHDLALVLGSGGVVGSSKLSHECIATVVVEIHTTNVCVIESAGAASLFAVAPSGSIKRGRLAATAAGSGEGRSLKVALVALVLAGKSLQQVGSALRGKLIVAQSDADRAAG